MGYLRIVTVSLLVIFVCGCNNEESATEAVESSQHEVAEVPKTEGPAPEFRDGDIIFQRSTSSQAKAIELATHFEYTH